MKKTLLPLLLLFIGFSLSAQDFLDGAFRFSSKKDSYIYLKDGTEVVGKIKDLDRKKGQIKKVKLKVDGKKVTYLPEDIGYMYLMPSGFDKFARGYGNLTNLKEHSKDRTVNLEKIKAGYVLFKSINVQLKKKEMQLLMQMVNPGYDEKIAVFFDPFARESMSLGVGGMTVAGGDKKSYYISVDGGTAYKIKQKEYGKKWAELYPDCPDIDKAFEGKMYWRNFSKHLYHYTTECN